MKTYTYIESGKSLLILALAEAFPERRHQLYTDVQGKSSPCLGGDWSSHTVQHSQGRLGWSRSHPTVMEP